MKSFVRYLDSDGFGRLLIGIGRPAGERGFGVTGWVLGEPSEEDRELILNRGMEKAWEELKKVL